MGCFRKPAGKAKPGWVVGGHCIQGMSLGVGSWSGVEQDTVGKKDSSLLRERGGEDSSTWVSESPRMLGADGIVKVSLL